jgi:hypothetical protein
MDPPMIFCPDDFSLYMSASEQNIAPWRATIVRFSRLSYSTST